jgi:hypothetical protein
MKMKNRVDPVHSVPSRVARAAADSEQAPVAAIPLALQGTVAKELSSTNKQKPPVASSHRKSVRQTFKTKPAITKHATASASVESSRVVVVSAEELKRERERAASPEVRKPRVPAFGLTGRLAFEALFKD